MVKGVIRKRGLLWNEVMIGGQCQGSGLMLQNEAVIDGQC